MKNIEIIEEKNCAWCEINGTFIYGKNVEEVKNLLKTMNKLGKNNEVY